MRRRHFITLPPHHALRLLEGSQPTSHCTGSGKFHLSGAEAAGCLSLVLLSSSVVGTARGGGRNRRLGGIGEREVGRRPAESRLRAAGSCAKRRSRISGLPAIFSDNWSDPIPYRFCRFDDV